MWGSDIDASSGTYKEMIARAYDAAKLLNQEEPQGAARYRAKGADGVEGVIE